MELNFSDYVFVRFHIPLHLASIGFSFLTVQNEMVEHASEVNEERGGGNGNRASRKDHIDLKNGPSKAEKSKKCGRKESEGKRKTVDGLNIPEEARRESSPPSKKTKLLQVVKASKNKSGQATSESRMSSTPAPIPGHPVPAARNSRSSSTLEVYV